MSETTTSHSADTTHTADASRRDRSRLILVFSLLFLVAAASLWLVCTEEGRRLLDPKELARLGHWAHAWVNENPASFICIFVAAYLVCAILLLPVWWLQLIAGSALGIWAGIATVMVASTIGALLTAVVSQWLGEAYVRSRIIGNGRAAQRLRRTVDAIGRNGLLVVFICRLSYPVPYGVSNYLFGLTGIRLRDIAIGTAIGGTPIYAGWVAAGARPDWLGRWEFWTVVIGVNLLLLVPLIIRSRRSKLVTK